MYNKRTSSERCNKRIKLDYLLEAGKHLSTKFWYVRLYLIIHCLFRMLIHRQYSFSDFLNSFSEEFKNQKVFLDSV